MASSVNFAQNTYSGEVLNDLLTYTAQGNDTYKEGLIHIKSGIQFKYTIPTIQLGKFVILFIVTGVKFKVHHEFLRFQVTFC